jgi:hypothetical protein
MKTNEDEISGCVAHMLLINSVCLFNLLTAVVHVSQVDVVRLYF